MQPIDKSLALLGATKNATLTEIKNSYKYYEDLKYIGLRKLLSALNILWEFTDRQT